MKTVVVFKWARDPQDARIGDGGATWPGVKFAATDDDPAAMDAAKHISAQEEDLIGLTIGAGKPEWAAARGAGRTVVIDDLAEDADANLIAAAMAEQIVALDGVDAVAIGDSNWNDAVVPALAAQLGWNAYAGVLDAQPAGDGLDLTLKRGDATVTVQAQTPVLLATCALGQEANVPGMKQTLAARKKPVEHASAPDAPTDGLDVVECGVPAGVECVLFDGSDPAQAAHDLAQALKSEGVL